MAWYKTLNSEGSDGSPNFRSLQSAPYSDTEGTAARTTKTSGNGGIGTDRSFIKTVAAHNSVHSACWRCRYMKEKVSPCSSDMMQFSDAYTVLGQHALCKMRCGQGHG